MTLRSNIFPCPVDRWVPLAKQMEQSTTASARVCCCWKLPQYLNAKHRIKLSKLSIRSRLVPLQCVVEQTHRGKKSPQYTASAQIEFLLIGVMSP